MGYPNIKTLLRVHFPFISFIVLFLFLSGGTARSSGRIYYSVQVASHKKLPNAEKAIRQLQEKGYDAFYKKVDIPDKGEWYRIYVGRFDNRKKALSFSKKMKADGITDFTMVHKFNDKVTMGVIDIRRILFESKAGKKAQDTYLEVLNAKRALFESKQKDLLEMEARFKQEEIILAPSQRDEKLKNISKERKELIRLKNDLENELKEKDRALTEDLLTEIKGVVKTFAEKEDYLILFEKSVAEVIDENVDFTDRIIELYDAQKEGEL